MEKSIGNRGECDKRLIETRNPWPERSRKSTRGSRSVLALTDRRPRIYALLTHTSVPSNRSTIAPPPFSAAFSFHRYSCLAYTGCWYIFEHAFRDRGRIQKLVDYKIVNHFVGWNGARWFCLFKLDSVLFNLNRWIAGWIFNC